MCDRMRPDYGIRYRRPTARICAMHRDRIGGNGECAARTGGATVQPADTCVLRTASRFSKKPYREPTRALRANDSLAHIVYHHGASA